MNVGENVKLGAEVGAPDGVIVGACEGNVGTRVGLNVGFVVGLGDGCVGLAVVGSTVGNVYELIFVALPIEKNGHASPPNCVPVYNQ